MEAEKRVYAVNPDETDAEVLSLPDDAFIELSEQQGLTYTLQGFVDNFNVGDISDQWYIRILNH